MTDTREVFPGDEVAVEEEYLASEGTFAKDGKIYGPGVLDMKGGLIIALYAVKALNSMGYNAHPIKFIVVGEEESDHVGNDGDKILTEESSG